MFPSGGEGGESGEGAAAGASGEGGLCTDDSGFHGLGCYRCTPTDVLSLERACTDAVCTGFDNPTRLTNLTSDGRLPSLPDPAAGSGGMGGAAGAGGSAQAGSGNAGSGGAGYSCQSLAQSGTIVYVTGSSAAKPFLQQIAQQLASDDVFIVYTSTGSCVGVDAVVNGTPMKTGASPAPAATATYWANSSSTGKDCDLPAAGVTADLGISDVFAQTCPGFELTDLDAQNIRDAHGPIQTMTFAVPANSPYSEISAQAAYFVFGFGADGGVLDPTGDHPIWNDEKYVFQRSATSGTQSMLASAIGVPSNRWRGKAHKTSDDVAADLESAGTDEASAASAIGIIAADYIDTKNLRAQLKVLAFQDTRGPCAVYPDSTANAHDKQNVRDGHYPVWGPLHLLYKVDQSGNPLNDSNREAVTNIVGYLSGTKALPNGVQLLDVYAQSGLVPECAMRVTRASDGGDIKPRVPSNPCACLFEAKATGETSCTPCTVQGDCASGETCSQGYCEK
jgi:ABC-type phosphate transport system substrate-binding protein